MNEFWNATGHFLRDMAIYAMIAIFLENTIFSRALGTSTALFIVRKRFNIFLFGLIMTAIIAVSSIGVYFISPILKAQRFSYYITPVVYVAIIGVVYVAALLITHKFVRKRREEILSIIHVSAFNCASLGAILLATNITGASLGAFLGFGIGSGLGFTLATFFVRLAYEHLSSDEVPETFRGFPITLIYIGLASLAIYGLIGHELPF